MKFETPKMNISLFAAENVVTDASAPTPGTTTNYDTAKNHLLNGDKAVEANNIVEFTFD